MSTRTEILMKISRRYRKYPMVGSSEGGGTGMHSQTIATSIIVYLQSPYSQHVVIPLSSDAEFFRTLTHEIASIDSIQSREEAAIKSHIVSLSDHITSVSKPSSFCRSSDLYAWREIFQMYTEAGIFFSPRERDGHKQRTTEGVKEKMHWFQTEMQRRGIVKSFRNKKSGGLLGDFVGVNLEILRLLRFRELNKTAMRKILKSTFIIPCMP